MQGMTFAGAITMSNAQAKERAVPSVVAAFYMDLFLPPNAVDQAIFSYEISAGILGYCNCMMYKHALESNILCATAKRAISDDTLLAVLTLAHNLSLKPMCYYARNTPETQINASHLTTMNPTPLRAS